MDVLSIGFVALMVVLAGVLCYTGDLLGRKLGKKRLTIGKLRPKHTAALMTGLFGGLSALAIVLILVGVSEPIRAWIVEGNKARAEAAQLRKEISDKQQQLSALEGRIPELQSKATDAEEKAKAAEGKLKEAEANLARAQASSAKLVAQANKLQTEARSLQSSIKSLTQDLKRTKGEYETVKNNLNEVTVNRNRAIEDVNKYSTENLRLVNEIGAKEKQLESLAGEVKSLTEAKETAEETLRKAEEEFKKAFDKSSADLRKVNQDLEESRGELERVESYLTQAQAQLDVARREIDNSNSALRLQQLMVNRGDELARVPVGVRLNQTEGRRLLLAAVKSASEEAARRGASPINGTTEFATFIDIPTDQRTITSEEQINAAVEALTNRDVQYLLILRSLFNTYRNEFVPIEVQIVRNPVVFTSGAVVDELTLDGSKTEQQISDDLAEYASGPLREKVLNAGIIPSVGRAQAIGELSRETIIRLVDDVKAMGRRVRVRLVAKADTRAGDVLILEYKMG